MEKNNPYNTQSDLLPEAPVEVLLAEASRQANCDYLTGIANRRSAERTVVHCLAEGNLTPGAMLFLDLDQFKQVNDTFGHSVGDSVLCSVADTLRKNVRQNDVVSRFGGDEFMVFLPHCPQTVALEKAQGLVAAVAALSLPCGCTASVGIALYPQHGTAFETLFALADGALYDAKAAGGNGYCLHTASPIPSHTPAAPGGGINRTYELEARLRAVRVEAGDICSFFTPPAGTHPSPRQCGTCIHAKSLLGADQLLCKFRP